METDPAPAIALIHYLFVETAPSNFFFNWREVGWRLLSRCDALIVEIDLSLGEAFHVGYIT